MKPFQFKNSQSLREAMDEMGGSGTGSRFYAGGTDLLGAMKDQIHPEPVRSLVNIKQIEELRGIGETEEGLRIGAAVTIHDLAENPMVQSGWPGLAEAARSVASPQLRNMGTVAGNICQEPRCWYYRYPDNFFHCLRKGGRVCNALTGENQYHSIFGAATVVRTPCSNQCPNQADIPRQWSFIRQGRFDLAAAALLERNPLPAVTGRVCPRFCEQGCARSEIDESVAIGSMERRLGDMVLEQPEFYFTPPESELLGKVVVVGAGPAGLSAAYYLRRQGFKVTVHDQRDKPGGMLTYCLPKYRFPQEVMDRSVNALRIMGVEFSLGRKVDAETFSGLIEGCDAVVLATGAWNTVSIGLSGEEHTLSALDFLAGVRSGGVTSTAAHVIVVGGGNVAVDAATTAKRLGAETVTMVCLESRPEMPADEPEIQRMLEEGVELRNGWGPSRLLEMGGTVMGLELVRCVSVFNSNGRFSPQYQESVRDTLKAGQVILAVGQKPDLGYLADGPGIAPDPVTADAETQETDRPGVFACGDMVTGPATVAQAVAAGRRAAMEIGRRLGLDPNDWLAPDEAPDSPGAAGWPASLLELPRQAESLKPPRERTVFSEDIQGLSEIQVGREAERCLNCGCLAVSPTDIGPALVAHKAVIVTSKRRIEAKKFFGVGLMVSTVLEPDELVIELLVPRPPNRTTGSAYCKFRIRNSIDFAIAGVSAWVHLSGGVVREARICLGAVAPVPLLAGEAVNISAAGS